MNTFQKVALSHDSLMVENESLKQINQELVEALERMTVAVFALNSGKDSVAANYRRQMVEANKLIKKVKGE